MLNMADALHKHPEPSNEELQKKIAELEELNRTKNSLLSFAAHQMKAPLGIVKGYATLFREGQYGEVSEKQTEVLRKIEFTADELVDLLANVIDLKKIEEGSCWNLRLRNLSCLQRSQRWKVKSLHCLQDLQ